MRFGTKNRFHRSSSPCASFFADSSCEYPAQQIMLEPIINHVTREDIHIKSNKRQSQHITNKSNVDLLQFKRDIFGRASRWNFSASSLNSLLSTKLSTFWATFLSYCVRSVVPFLKPFRSTHVGLPAWRVLPVINTTQHTAHLNFWLADLKLPSERTCISECEPTLSVDLPWPAPCSSSWPLKGSFCIKPISMLFFYRTLLRGWNSTTVDSSAWIHLKSDGWN